MAAVLAIAVLLASFGFIAHAVATGKPTTLDRRVMLALRSGDDPTHPIGPAWVQEAARDVTSCPSGCTRPLENEAGEVVTSEALPRGYACRRVGKEVGQFLVL